MRHDWEGLLGIAEAELLGRLGRPATRRAAGDDLWLVFEPEPGRLRVRCRLDPAAAPHVASWTLALRRPAPTLEAAARSVGLWPAASPDVAAAEVDVPLVRRALRTPGGAVVTLTATVRAGAFDRLSMFDEPPDWP